MKTLHVKRSRSHPWKQTCDSSKCAKGSFVLIGVGHPEKNSKIEDAHRSQKPEEIVKLAVVEIIGQPPRAAVPGGGFGNDSDKKRADILSECHREQRQSRAHASHGVWSLLVEELQLPYEREHFCTPYYEVLRHLVRKQNNYIFKFSEFKLKYI